jgi:hypothetical protein
LSEEPLDDDAEEVALQELTQHIERLDALDRDREKAWRKVDQSLKDLAKARGLAFIRLESVRQEIENA